MAYIKNAAFVAAAQRCYNDEGTLEVDDNAKVSRGGDGRGAYVQGWVWVANDDVIEEDFPKRTKSTKVPA